MPISGLRMTRTARFGSLRLRVSAVINPALPAPRTTILEIFIGRGLMSPDPWPTGFEIHEEYRSKSQAPEKPQVSLELGAWDLQLSPSKAARHFHDICH